MSRSMVRVVARTWPWDRSLACLVLFFYVSTFFGVERGGIGGFGVFDIHTLPPLYLRYGRYYMVGDSAVAPASSCRSGLPDFGLVFLTGERAITNG